MTRITVRHAACVLAASVGLLAALPAGAQETGTTQNEQSNAGQSPPGTTADSGFFFWSDTSLSLLYGTGFVIDPKTQTTVTLEHAHESKIGDMFLFVDATDYHSQSSGDSTWYGEIGPRLSFGKLLGKDLSRTLAKRSLFQITDVLLAAQYERGEDPDLAEAALIGIGLNLDVREAGILGGLGKFNYVQLNFYGRANLAKGAEGGISDLQTTMVASYPFTIGSSQFLIDGYFDWVAGFGDDDWSFHLNPQLTMDMGALWDAPGKFFAGLELDLWLNKYQIPNTSSFDTNQLAVSLLLKYHL